MSNQSAVVPAAPLTLPDELTQEDSIAQTARSQSIATLALQDPLAVKRYLEKLEEGLAILRQVAIKSTTPKDWTRYKDKEGVVICVLRDNGATNIRKWLGISIFGYRGDPLDAKVPGPKVSSEKQDDGKSVTVVELWADAHCARTGETVEGIYSAIRTDQRFRGRETLQDDKASVRTYLDTKCTRILSGLRKVPEAVLVEAGLDVAACYAGSGFGTSSERGAGRVAEAGIKEGDKGLDALKAEVLKRVGGDTDAARSLAVDITKNPAKGFKGFDSLDRLTQGWQIESAWKALKAHPMFGDGHGEPGSQG